MENIELPIKIKRQGKWLVISSEKIGITTQGRTPREAWANFYEAVTLCFSDSEWREAHNIKAVSQPPAAYSGDRSTLTIPVVLSDWKKIAKIIGNKINPTAL